MDTLAGRVAIITGAGRGIGREHALLFAKEGAKVVVNDLGGSPDGTGADRAPAQQVVDEITAAGGEAVANYDDVADWEGAQRLINQAVETFGDLHVLVNNAGILRDRMLPNMSEEEWDAIMRVHLRGHFCPTRWAAAYWRDQSKTGRGDSTGHRQHVLDLRSVRQPGPDQLRRSQDRHRHLLDHRRRRTGPLRRAGQRHRPGGGHPAHRYGPAGAAPGGPSGGHVDPDAPGEYLAVRRLPLDRVVPYPRSGVFRPGRRRLPVQAILDRRPHLQGRVLDASRSCRRKGPGSRRSTWIWVIRWPECSGADHPAELQPCFTKTVTPMCRPI